MVTGIQKGGIIRHEIQSPEAEHSRELLKLWHNNGGNYEHTIQFSFDCGIMDYFLIAWNTILTRGV